MKRPISCEEASAVHQVQGLLRRAGKAIASLVFDLRL